MVLVLTVLLSIMLGTVCVVGVFMSGLSGEPLIKIAARGACTAALILIVLFFFR